MSGSAKGFLKRAPLLVVGVALLAGGVVAVISSQYLSAACNPDVQGSWSTSHTVSAWGDRLVLTGLVLSVIGAIWAFRLMGPLKAWLIFLIPFGWWLIEMIGEYFGDLANEREGGLDALAAGAIPVGGWILVGFLIWAGGRTYQGPGLHDQHHHKNK